MVLCFRLGRSECGSKVHCIHGIRRVFDYGYFTLPLISIYGLAV